MEGRPEGLSRSAEIRISVPDIDESDVAAVVAALRSGTLTRGPRVERFEAEFSELVGQRACVSANSGTSALHAALLALGIGRGDEVVVPSFSFAATANAVRLASAKPVFADVEPTYFAMDPAHVEAVITPRTAAIVPVHLYGHMADVRVLGQVAARHGLAMVEDAAQAHAASRDGIPVGTASDVACFSFYPSKNMTTGEGGMVVAKDPRVAEVARQLANQGMDVHGEHVRVGANWRMTELEAALGRSQLRRLEASTATRIANAERYGRQLPAAITPQVAPGARHVFNQYTLELEDRPRVASLLAERSIESRLYYPQPIHRLPHYADEYGSADLPVTMALAQRVLSVPVHPRLRKDEIDTICDVLALAGA